MPTDILMPAVHPGMATGRLVRWLVAEGETIAPGRVIAEVASEAGTTQVAAADAGRIVRLLVPAGEAAVRVDQPIAVLGNAPSAAGSRRSPPRDDAPRRRASPLARRLAFEAGIDLADIHGTGPTGRILKRDVGQALRSGAGADGSGPRGDRRRRQAETGSDRRGFADWTVAGNVAAQSADERVLSHYPRGSYDVVPHDRLRRHVADRAREAQLSVPQQTVAIDVRADALLVARRQANAMPYVKADANTKPNPLANSATATPARAERLPGAAAVSGRISITDMLIKALALALQQVPAANAAWTELGMLRHKSCDIGVAIALEGGVVTPVIRNAEVKSVAEISAELRALRERAERGRLTLEETRGGVSTLSNLGMLGVTRCTGIVNPPQASILAVGVIAERPGCVDGQIQAATLMSCALSADQRIIDGALAAQLLAALRAHIEAPGRLLAEL